MRENKYHNGTGWGAAELFGKDRYSTAGTNSWEDTVEIRVNVLEDIDDFIDKMRVRDYFVGKTMLPDVREYLFAYVPVGTAEDFMGSLENEMRRINRNRSLENKSCEPTEKLDFSKMYREFEDKYNPYPVQMSRSDAFLHALKDNLITKDEYNAAREYYGNLWNYVGD